MNSYTFFSELPYMHILIETQHLHLAIFLMLLSFTSAFAFSSYSCPSDLRTVCIKVIPRQEFQGSDTAIVSGLLEKKYRARKEAQ